MSQLFLKILNMSLTAGFVIVMVIVARLLLKRMPKIISYGLWVVVGLRLILPFSIESVFSLLPRATSQDVFPTEMIFQLKPQVHSSSPVVNQIIEHVLPPGNPAASVNPLQIWLEIAAFVWLLGVMVLLIHCIFSLGKLKRSLKTSEFLRANIYESNVIQTPFVLGIMRPKIYLPKGLNPTEQAYIIRHEQVHIKRRDPLIKGLAYFIVCLHWFNPLVWLSFVLMTKDMELSCDEKVLAEEDWDVKQSYASSLLTLATRDRILNSHPIAFGEGNLKERIHNVLNFKKRAFWMVALSLLLVVGFSMALLTSPKPPQLSEPGPAGVAKNQLGASKTNSESGVKRTDATQTTTGDDDSLLKYQTNYIGDNAKVSNIINRLNFPDDLKVDSLDLLSTGPPPGISLKFKTHEKGNDYYGTTEDIYTFRKNAFILMALVKQAVAVSYLLDDGNSVKFYTFTRAQANQALGEDVTNFAKSKEKLGELLRSNAPLTGGEKALEESLGYYETEDLDPTLRMVYETLTAEFPMDEPGFLILAPKIYHKLEEGNKLKVFVDVHSAVFTLMGNELISGGRALGPKAITYRKVGRDQYALERIDEAQSGTLYESSIREYCKTPVSGKIIKGLAEQLMNNESDLQELLFTNLTRYLDKKGIKGATLRHENEVEYSQDDLVYQP